MRELKNYIIPLVWVLMIGCLEPYEPDISDSENEFLIVDGIITNQPGPYTVKIFKSNSFDDNDQPVSGLTVSIEEQEGASETLVEITPGIYQTSSIQGVVGNSYRLLINFEGQQYQSTWETILDAPPFDSIYYEYQVRGTTDRENDQEGLQFFVDNQGTENGTRFYRYEWEETWQFGVRWPSTADYIGNDQAVATDDPRYLCWKTKVSTGINIATTVGLSENVLSGHPLFYASRDEERFTQRYSLLLKQYALAENEYNFWQGLKESNQELGSLFDKQPGNVLGNISNVADPGDVALGYFSAAGSHEQRIFVERTGLPPSLTSIPPCSPLDSLLKADFIMMAETYEEGLLRNLNNGQFFIGFVISETNGTVVGSLLSSPRCSDCTFKGGDLNKPDFWDD